MDTGWTNLLPALVMGLASTAHCGAMCGGYVVAFSTQRLSPAQLVTLHAGRILTYVAIATLFAALLSMTPSTGPLLLVINGALLSFLGWHLMAPSRSLATLDRFGARLTQPMQRLRNALLPITSFRRALAFGMLWGLLPCAMVYGAIAFGGTQGSTSAAALTVFAFGLGTLPGLAAMHLLSHRAQRILKSAAWRRAMGTVLIAWGIGTLGLALWKWSSGATAGPHSHHMHASAERWSSD